MNTAATFPFQTYSPYIHTNLIYLTWDIRNYLILGLLISHWKLVQGRIISNTTIGRILQMDNTSENHLMYYG